MRSWKKWGILLLAFALLLLVPVSAKAAPGGSYSVMKNGKWKTINGKIYYYGKNGRKATGWVKIQGVPYFFRKNGAMKAGWLNFKGRYYHYGNDGVCHTGWFKKAGRKYYCDPKRGKLNGWNVVAGEWYFFKKSGCVATNKWIRNGNALWYVNAAGKVVKRKAKNNQASGYDTILMVGGSRFRHMDRKYGLTADNVRYIAQGGAKVDWLKKEAYPQIKNAVVKGKKTAIVFNLGLNDMKHVDLYLQFYNRKLSDLLENPECDLFIMSVNPVDDKKYGRNEPRGQKHNQQVLLFNQKMRSQLDSRYHYMDTYQYLTERFNMAEMTIGDGIHYTRKCSQLIFQRCMRFLKDRKM